MVTIKENSTCLPLQEIMFNNEYQKTLTMMKILERHISLQNVQVLFASHFSQV